MNGTYKESLSQGACQLPGIRRSRKSGRYPGRRGKDEVPLPGRCPEWHRAVRQSAAQGPASAAGGFLRWQNHNQRRSVGPPMRARSMRPRWACIACGVGGQSSPVSISPGHLWAGGRFALARSAENASRFKKCLQGWPEMACTNETPIGICSLTGAACVYVQLSFLRWQEDCTDYRRHSE